MKKPPIIRSGHGARRGSGAGALRPDGLRGAGERVPCFEPEERVVVPEEPMAVVRDDEDARFDDLLAGFEGTRRDMTVNLWRSGGHARKARHTTPPRSFPGCPT